MILPREALEWVKQSQRCTGHLKKLMRMKNDWACASWLEKNHLKK